MSTHSISAPAPAGNTYDGTDPWGLGRDYRPAPMPSVDAQTVVAHAQRQWGTLPALALLMGALQMARTEDDRAFLLAQAEAAERAIPAPSAVLSVFRQGIPWVGAAVMAILAAVAVTWFLV